MIVAFCNGTGFKIHIPEGEVVTVEVNNIYHLKARIRLAGMLYNAIYHMASSERGFSFPRDDQGLALVTAARLTEDVVPYERNNDLVYGEGASPGNWCCCADYGSWQLKRKEGQWSVKFVADHLDLPEGEVQGLSKDEVRLVEIATGLMGLVRTMVCEHPEH